MMLVSTGYLVFAFIAKVTADLLYFCYEDSQVEYSGGEHHLMCENNHVIRFSDQKLFKKRSCSSISAMPIQSSEYVLELHRRCSAQQECDMSNVESIQNLPEAFFVFISFNCIDIRSAQFDPCRVDTADVREEAVYLGISLEKYRTCQCTLTPQWDTAITSIQIQDARTAFLDGSCTDTTELTITAASRTYNCSDFPLFQNNNVMKDPSNPITDPVEVILKTGKSGIQMMWIDFELSDDKRIAVQCSSTSYQLTSPTQMSTAVTTTKQTSAVVMVKSTESVSPGTEMIVDVLTTMHVGYGDGFEDANDSGLSNGGKIAIAVAMCAIVLALLTAAAILLHRRMQRFEKTQKIVDNQEDVNVYDEVPEDRITSRQSAVYEEQNTESRDTKDLVLSSGGIVNDGHENPAGSQEFDQARGPYTEINITSTTADEHSYSQIERPQRDVGYSHLHVAPHCKSNQMDTYSHIHVNNEGKPLSFTPINQTYNVDTYSHLNSAGNSTMRTVHEDTDGYSSTSYRCTKETDANESQRDAYSHLGTMNQGNGVLENNDGETYENTSNIGQHPGQEIKDDQHMYFILEPQ